MSLPCLPSALLRTATDSLRRYMAGGVVVVLSERCWWMVHTRTGAQRMCLAGALLRWTAETGERPQEAGIAVSRRAWLEYSPYAFPDVTARVLAVNQFRQGRLQAGLRLLHLPAFLPDVPVPRWTGERNGLQASVSLAFFKAMERTADLLAEVSL